MGWKKHASGRGGGSDGVTLALRVDANGQKVALRFGADVVAAVPCLEPGCKVDIWLGDGDDRGRMQVRSSNEGRKLQCVVKGDQGRSSLTLAAWDMDYDRALGAVRCEWRVVDGVFEVDLPAQMYPAKNVAQAGRLVAGKSAGQQAAKKTHGILG